MKSFFKRIKDANNRATQYIQGADDRAKRINFYEKMIDEQEKLKEKNEQSKTNKKLTSSNGENIIGIANKSNMVDNNADSEEKPLTKLEALKQAKDSYFGLKAANARLENLLRDYCKYHQQLNSLHDS